MIQVPPEGEAAFIGMGLDCGEFELMGNLIQRRVPFLAPGVEISTENDRSLMISQLRGHRLKLLTKTAQPERKINPVQVGDGQTLTTDGIASHDDGLRNGEKRLVGAHHSSTERLGSRCDQHSAHSTAHRKSIGHLPREPSFGKHLTHWRIHHHLLKKEEIVLDGMV
jgi:hypothetical protein